MFSGENSTLDWYDLGVAVAYDRYYSKAYTDSEDQTSIARLYHGIQHAARAAIYVAVLANLYRCYGNQEALNLSNDEIQLIQLAVIFHDSARKSDGIDEWDKDSALNFYNYLVNELKFENVNLATKLAEAIANKDITPDKCYLNLVHGKWVTNPYKEKNIYEKLIHDADCLDVQRVRKFFDGRYLEFYQDYGINNDDALDDLSELRTEAASFIARQGDEYLKLNIAIKSKLENSESHKKQKLLLNSYENNYPILIHLGNHLLLTKEELLSWKKKRKVLSKKYSPTEPLNEENIRCALKQGLIISRSVINPSDSRKKIGRNAEIIHEDPEELLGSVEVRKAARREKIPTKTKKSNNIGKHGNKVRSTSLLAYGTIPYANVGFLIINPEMKNISAVSTQDANTGTFKKQDSKNKQRKDNEEIISDYFSLQRQCKRGNPYNQDSASKHNEILYDIDKFDAIYYCYDSVICEDYISNHPAAAPLLAIFLQNVYAMQHDGRQLPIFEYSGIHNDILLKTFSEDEIVKLWENLCESYMQNELENQGILKIQSCTIDDIKINSMYNRLSYSSIRHNPADIYYTETLKIRINDVIQKKREQLLKVKHDELNQILETIESKDINYIFEKEIYAAFFTFPDLCQLYKPTILKFIEKYVSTNTIVTINQIQFDYSSVNMFDSRIAFLTSRQEPDNWLKLFLLAELIGVKDIEESIKKLLIISISEYNPSEFNINEIKKIFYLMKFILKDNVDNSFLLKIKKMIDNQLTEYNDLQNNQINTTLFSDIIEFCIKNNLLTNELREKVDNIIIRFNQNIKINSPLSSLFDSSLKIKNIINMLGCMEVLSYQKRDRENLLIYFLKETNFLFNYQRYYDESTTTNYFGNQIAKIVAKHIDLSNLDNFIMVLDKFHFNPDYHNIEIFEQFCQNILESMECEKTKITVQHQHIIKMKHIELTEKLLKNCIHKIEITNNLSCNTTSLHQLKKYFLYANNLSVSKECQKEMLKKWWINNNNQNEKSSKIFSLFPNDLLQQVAKLVQNDIPLLKDFFKITDDNKSEYHLLANAMDETSLGKIFISTLKTLPQEYQQLHTDPRFLK